ncbi:hypothetical protein Tco_1174953 [Tanacetum coccineum]
MSSGTRLLSTGKLGNRSIPTRKDSDLVAKKENIAENKKRGLQGILIYKTRMDFETQQLSSLGRHDKWVKNIKGEAMADSGMGRSNAAELHQYRQTEQYGNSRQTICKMNIKLKLKRLFDFEESFAPVAPLEAVRIFVAPRSTQVFFQSIIMD